MRIKLTLITIFIALSLGAVPTRRGSITITQPDGYSFTARVKGDAFMRIMTTEDGASIKKAEDGYYYYAVYDGEGKKVCTSFRVGDAVPANILSDSRYIPYHILGRRADQKRYRLRWDGRPNLEKRIRASHPVSTKAGSMERHGLVILAEFSDVKFTYTKDDFVRLLNGDTDNSAVAYFNDQFGGEYDFKFTVSNIVTLPEKEAFYGTNNSDDEDQNAALMIKEACQAADAEIDFSVFDDDGDGYVDNVFVFFAGKDEADDPDANADCIWSHAYYLSGDGIKLVLDDKRIDSYACTAELMRLYQGGKYTMASIGTFCHEYSHTFGLPDYYDTDYEGSGGQSDGLWGSISLMDSGNYNNDGYCPPYYNAVDRYELGMSEPVILTSGTHTLEPIHKNGKFYIIPTDNEKEYFLLECRSSEKWDRYIGGSGLIIYHIDKSDRSAGASDKYGDISAYDRWFVYNEVNARPDHQCADLIEANPSAGVPNQVFWPQTGHTTFSPSSDPAFVFWSGEESSMALTGIRKSGDNIVFTAVGGVVDKAPDAIIDSQDIFQDAAIIRWSASDPSYAGNGYISFSLDSSEEKEYVVPPYEEGKYAFVIDGLSPRTAYSAKIYFKASGIPGTVNDKCKFTTKSSYSGTYPYIILSGAERGSDGSFAKGTEIPLRVCNATDAEGVQWYFNNSEIAPSDDGYYHLKKSGTIRAEVIYSDGSKDVIVKEIIVK